MRGDFLKKARIEPPRGNIYANRSALILEWLLTEGVDKKEFGIRDVQRDCGVSVGLVQKVFTKLVWDGILQIKGVRTAKKFSITNPKKLLVNWREHYNILEKCRTWTYQTGMDNREELINSLSQIGLENEVSLALHSAAEGFGVKYTNLTTLELYLHEPNIRQVLEKSLMLEQVERGYEVLLIEPYYKKLLLSNKQRFENILVTPVILTYLDLYNFPLRGIEQAEHMAFKLPELKKLFE